MAPEAAPPKFNLCCVPYYKIQCHGGLRELSCPWVQSPPLKKRQECRFYALKNLRPSLRASVSQRSERVVKEPVAELKVNSEQDDLKARRRSAADGEVYDVC